MVGAGSLKTQSGADLVDTPEFPAMLSPPVSIEVDGARTGSFRSGDDTLITDAQGASRISAADLAVAVVDEVEQPRHPRRRFTVGY